MASRRSNRLAANYSGLTKRIRAALLARLTAMYTRTVDPDDIAESTVEFAAAAVPLIEAGQASMTSAAAALVDAIGAASAAVDDRIPGTTREGRPLVDGVAAWGPMILGRIADGEPVEAALDFGRYVVERFADNELTGAADREIEHQSAALGELIGWEGAVQPDACDPCQENVGAHPLDWVAYRHPYCGCVVIPVFRRR